VHLIDTVPWFLPGAAAWLVVGLAAGGPVGRALGVSRLVAVVLVLGLGLVVSATLTPQRDALDFGATGSGRCEIGRVTLASLDFYGADNDAGENILLFVPIGVAVALLPRSRRKVTFLTGVVLLPFAIEGIQLQARVLNRACQSADIVDNLAGLAIGLAIGGAFAGAGWVVARRRGCPAIASPTLRTGSARRRAGPPMSLRGARAIS
jgi:hypothetical protein